MSNEPAESTAVSRDLGPFAYFADQASVFVGMGGSRASPDPRYCFHTAYVDFNPGHVVFSIKLIRCSATGGTLTVRLHGFRPKTDFDISLVAGNQVDLGGLDNDDVELIIRASAIPGVHYALYGYLSEPGEVRCSTLTISVVELGGDDARNYAEAVAQHSSFLASPFQQTNHLITASPPSFARPISQPMTAAQLNEPAYLAAWPDRFDALPTSEQWARRYALNVLREFGFLRTGARGLLFDPLTDESGLALTEHGCVVVLGPDSHSEAESRSLSLTRTDRTMAELADEGAQFDFAVAFDTGVPSDGIAERMQALLRCVLRDGLAVFIVPVQPLPNPGEADEGNILSVRPNDLSRLALSALAHGSEVAQLSFGWDALEHDKIAPVPYALLIKR